MTSRRVVIGMVVLSLLVVACGQYPGVHEQRLAGLRDNTLVAGEEAAPGESLAPQVAPPAGAGAASGRIAGGRGAPAPQAQSTRAASGGVSGGDTTGVTPTTIKVGLHAPLTGAAPLKASSFATGKSLYWEKGDNGKPIVIHGRRVELIFRDDQYNPSHARLVCQDMAEGQKSFLLIGGGGTDQIQACAQYAASRGIPYLSVGTTEVGLRKLRNYFPLTMSYAQQAPLLAAYIKNTLKVTDAKRVAAVVTNTANFDDFAGALQHAFPGITVFRPDKNERGSIRASSLCTGTVKNFDVVVTPNAPAYFLELAGASKCKPLFVGPGITNGLDEVADLGCKSDQSTVGARFFSPAPSYNDALQGKWDPVFRKVKPSDADDIVWLLWAISKSVHQLLLKAGANPTREGFISANEVTSDHSGIFPDATYTSANHFGAKQVNVLQNVCRARGSSSGYYVTEAAFKSAF
jgi:branched-chain amino acid transport system substrate-binding protein